MITKSTIKNIDEALCSIYENEKSFIDRFTNNFKSLVIDITNISFNTEKVKFVCVMNDGAHWVLDCSISDFNEWLEEIENK